MMLKNEFEELRNEIAEKISKLVAETEAQQIEA